MFHLTSARNASLNLAHLRGSLLAFVIIIFFVGAAQSVKAATYTVTITGDSGAGSLRQAISDANATAAADTVVFNIPSGNCNPVTGVCTITLTSEIIVSNNGSLNITGTGANHLTIDGGAGTNRIFSSNNATFTLSGATLTGGGGTGADNSGNGGAIYALEGVMTINSVYFTGNTAGGFGGAIDFAFNFDRKPADSEGLPSNIIRNSTFSGNSSSSQDGGAIHHEKDLAIINSTFTGNTSGNSGGAISSQSNLTLVNDTITGNMGRYGGGIYRGFNGFSFSNTIIAGNTASIQAPEIYNETSLTSGGYNFIGDSAGDSTATANSITYQGTDIRDTPPLLDALGNYGGALPTIRLQATSPAIDKGSATGVFSDGRGAIRPFDNPAITNAASGSGADIGAFELQTSIVRDWGFNSFGQLGIGNFSSQTTPQTVVGFNDITQFNGGGFHTVALLSNGTVVTAGYNFYGQLGDGAINKSSQMVGCNCRPTFGTVTGGNVVNAVAVSSGSYHSLALRADGTVWAWGRNLEGQLGDGTNINNGIPVQVGAGIPAFNTHVIAVSGGSLHNLALTDDGKVWAWGYNGNGQLGDGTIANSSTPVPVLASMGGAQLSGIEQISAGELHSTALTTGGAVLVWGYNSEGQVGNNTTGSSVPFPAQTINTLMGTITSISTGAFHTVAVNTAGDVYAWGQGSLGQIGDNNTANALAPRKTLTVANVVRVEAHDANHTLARQRDGTLFVWGDGSNGQIGNGSTGQQLAPLNISAVTGTGGNLGTNIAVFGTGGNSSFATAVPEISTPAGAGILRGDQFSVAFPALTQAGASQVRTFDPTATGLNVPAGYTIQANTTGYDISTTATFPGTATICLKITNVIDAATFGRLYILHDDNGDGTLDAAAMSRNYQKREICRTTASFSPFVVALGPAAPTVAGVSISGRVSIPQDLGLTNALVTLTDSQGNSRTLLTGKFGTFHFTEVAAGETYILSVHSKRYTYAPQVITVTGDVTEVNFSPQ